MKEAMYWEGLENNKVRCLLCPHRCKILPGRVGICRARKNIDGKLFSLIYGRYSSIHLDPIEKKPLYHFYPGRYILSLGTLGCNLRCTFCQNWSISHVSADTIDGEKLNYLTQEIVPSGIELLLKKTGPSNIGISYTYNEPFIWYEFVLDSAKKVRKLNLKNVLVTNGFVNEEPLREIIPYIDAMNIDLKSINPDFYKRICGGNVDDVKNTLKNSYGKCHIEITNLIIPTLNDSPSEIEELIDWIAGELSPDIPIHFSRYHPDYKMKIPATPLETLKMAYEKAVKKLKYVYIGNVWDNKWNNTVCPNCLRPVIEREGFTVISINIDSALQCIFCGNYLNIVNS